MASIETHSKTMPLKAITFLALMFLAFTSTASTRVLTDVETPTTTAPEELPDSAESPVSSTVTPPLTAATPAAAIDSEYHHHTLSFFMHDILGGSNPTARAVTGVVTNPAVNAQVAFAKPNGANLPLNNGVPQNNNNAGILNNNNLPFITGLSGSTGNVFNNNNNGNGNGFSVTNPNNLPAGLTLQKLMFGTMTVFDDELTEGHELGSGLVGKAHGFYIASSVDGTSQVMAFTAKFEENGYVDSLSFFGVHRTQVSESQLAIIGGTGKYVNAEGFAIIKTFPVTNDQQHNTDGLETLLQLTAYLA
ncbi:dirigent protein 10-like [Lotus japonicus]|uniref:dirigent protein 10-like n=1 Tax=Lotus japonicus TaxID=34305 RepID=UPI0025894C48|nr:dirigent protein 10-like [Lotus japonicus]